MPGTGLRGVGVSYEKLSRNFEMVSTVSDCLVNEEDIGVECCGMWVSV
jgi:hypothetical protein